MICGAICAATSIGLAMILSITVCSWIIAFERDWYKGDYVIGDLNHMTYIERDWQKKPYEDIIVTEDAECPATHPEAVFFDVWPGLRPYCDCLLRDMTYELDYYCAKSKGGSDRSPFCYNMLPHMPVKQTNLGKFKICGK